MPDPRPHRPDIRLEGIPLLASVATGWTLRIAQGTSYLINPLLLPVVFLGLILLHTDAPIREALWTLGVGFVFFALVPLAFLVWMVHTNQVRTLEVHSRRRRLRPFLVGLTSYAVGVGGLFIVGRTAAPLIGILGGCMLLNAVVLAVVTLRWKISIHAAAIAGFVSMLAFVLHTALPMTEGSLLSPSVLYVTAALIPLVMWARVHTGGHTARQVWAGALFGLAGPFLELYLLMYLI